MSQICIWCRREWEAVTSTGGPITGNTCLECRERLFREQDPIGLREFLDELDVPVLVMDGGAKVVGFNEKAAEFLGKPGSELKGRYGDVVECAYAQLAGGCGNTVHCQACAIRHSVSGTALTGDPHQHVPAYQDMHCANGRRESWFLISTEKVGAFVLLRIEPGSR